MTDMKLEIRDGKSTLGKIFICHGAPCSMTGKNPEVLISERIGDLQSASKTQSPLARDLSLLFKENDDWIYPAQRIVLAAADENGVPTDVLGITLHKGFSWTPDLEQQAKSMFQRRITTETGVSLPIVPKDFHSATDQEVQKAFTAILPSEVFKDNPDPQKAVIVESIDRKSGGLSYRMSQACAEAACGVLAVQQTQRRIESAIKSHYGLTAIRVK